MTNLIDYIDHASSQEKTASTEWIIKPLSTVTTKIGSGATPRGGETAYKANGISLIRSLNVHDSGFRHKELAFIDDVQAESLSNVNIEPHDVLLNITGASIARCCTVPDSVLPARVNQHVSILRPVKGLLSSRFLHYLLISPQVKRRLLRAGDAGSTRQALTKGLLQEFQIAFPKTMKEQERIVGTLDDLFEGVAATRTNVEHSLKSTGDLFVGQLYRIFSEAWRSSSTVRMSDLATDITDGDHMPPPKSNQGVPFVTISNINKQTHALDFSDTYFVTRDYFDALKPNKKPRRGDLLYTVTGSFGIPVKVEDDADFCFQRHIGLIRPKPDVSTSWLYYLALSPQLSRQASERATGTAQKTVSLSVLRDLSVPKLNLSKQILMTAQLDELKRETERLATIYRSKLDALDELKQAILSSIFSPGL